MKYEVFNVNCNFIDCYFFLCYLDEWLCNLIYIILLVIGVFISKGKVVILEFYFINFSLYGIFY